MRLIFSKENFPCRSTLGWNFLFPTDKRFFFPKYVCFCFRSLVYLFEVCLFRWSVNEKMSGNEIFTWEPLPNTSFTFNKSIGLVIPACQLHQRVLRSTRSLVIYAVDGTLRNKLNKKLVRLRYPRLLFSFLFFCSCQALFFSNPVCYQNPQVIP